MFLVTGATGRVGRVLVRELVARRAPVRALVRNRARATALEGTGVRMVVGDLAEPDTLAAACDGVERLFLTAPLVPERAELVAAGLAAAAAAGVRAVVHLSADGAARESAVPLLRWHGESEERVAASGLAWTELRAAPFLQNLLAFAPGLAAHGEIVGPDGAGELALVDTHDVARAAAVALTAPGHAGATYRLTGPEPLSLERVATVLAAVLGRPVRRVARPPDEARRGLEAAGLSPPLAESLVALLRPAAAAPSGGVGADVERLTGRPAVTLAAFARRHAALLRGDESATGSE